MCHRVINPGDPDPEHGIVGAFTLRRYCPAALR